MGVMMSPMADWVEDESLTPEETLARFEALSPEPTSGPGRTEHFGVPVKSKDGMKRLEHNHFTKGVFGVRLTSRTVGTG